MHGPKEEVWILDAIVVLEENANRDGGQSEHDDRDGGETMVFYDQYWRS